MKKKFLTFCLILSAAFVYQSCDYVINAVPASQNSGSSSTGSTTIYRKVLIEDYTGHKCGNCPAAARELHKLDSIYTGKIVDDIALIIVHGGSMIKIA